MPTTTNHPISEGKMGNIFGFNHGFDFVVLDVFNVFGFVLHCGFRIFVVIMLYKIYKKLK